MNTQQARSEYRDHIGGFYKSGTSYGRPYLRTGWTWARVKFPAEGPFTAGYVNLAVHPDSAAAMRAIASVMLDQGYYHRETAGGTISMRNITGANKETIDRQVALQYPLATSIHAHGCAMDVNPSKNAYGAGKDEIDSTKVPTLWKAIKTIDGYQVVRWGGDWSVDDGMHVEATGCTRAQLKRGIDVGTVAGWSNYLEWIGEGVPAPDPDPVPGPGPVSPTPTGGLELLPIKAGSSPEDIRLLQDHLNYQVSPSSETYLTVDGVYGAATIAMVKKKVGSLGKTAAQIAGEEVGYRQWNYIEYIFMTRTLADQFGSQVTSGYTKAESDSKYATKVEALTEAKADARYPRKGETRQITL